MVEWNIAFDHDDFWQNKVSSSVEAYREFAQYLYDYEIYLIDIANFKDTLEPVIEDLIIYDYIDDL